MGKMFKGSDGKTMTDKSSCCQAPVTVRGDTPGDNEGTRYYVCSKCIKACDIANPMNLTRELINENGKTESEEKMTELEEALLDYTQKLEKMSNAFKLSSFWSQECVDRCDDAIKELDEVKASLNELREFTRRG